MNIKIIVLVVTMFTIVLYMLTNLQETVLEPNIDNYDLYYHASEIQLAAEAGDAEKQYQLANILSICKSILFMRDIDMIESDSPLAQEIHSWWSARCSGFTNENISTFGDRYDWIKKSASGGYAAAIVLQLSQLSGDIRTDENLTNLREAISSLNKNVMGNLAGLTKNEETAIVWSLLACDYGYDCSSESKEPWRVVMARYCFDKSNEGNQCDTNMDYNLFIQQYHTKKIYEKLLARKKELKGIIESMSVSELSWEMILD